MKEDQLKGYFSFTNDDLAANRAGKLSQKQYKRIKENNDFADKFVLGLFAVFLIAGLFTTFQAFSQMTNIGLWVAAAVLLSIAGWAFRGVLTKVDDSVQKAEGKVDFVKVEKQTGSATDPSYKRSTVSSYEMRVGGEAFGNANPALIEYMQSDVYAVYFTKATRQILSVEFLSKGK
jgi:hypothetical protein